MTDKIETPDEDGDSRPDSESAAEGGTEPSIRQQEREAMSARRAGRMSIQADADRTRRAKEEAMVEDAIRENIRLHGA